MPDAPATPLVEIGHVVDAPTWWAALDYETTPELRWPTSIDVFDRMRKQDAQVVSVLRAVTLPVRRTSWRVDPNGARPEVAQLVAEDLGLPLAGADSRLHGRSRDRFSWKNHLRLALLMLPMGHSFFEQVYRIDGGMVRLRKLAERPSRTIHAIHVAPDGGLMSIEQWGNPDGRHVRPQIPVDRLVAYVNEREGGNWVGQSLLRSCYKNWLIKDRMLRVQAQTVERNGMGVPLYTGAEGEEDLAPGRKLATAWRSGDASGAAVPYGADLKLRGVEGELPDADVPIRYHDEQIARAVLAHFLNLGTQTGSWALGTTFADFFTLSLQTVAQEIADVTNQHVVEDLIDLNWGPDEPAPRVVFDEIGSRHQITAEAIKLLVEAGALTPDESVEQFARNAYGLPSATDTPGGRPAENARQARNIVEMVQKVYLGIGKVVTTDEARELINQAGGSLPIPGPEFPGSTPQVPPPPDGGDQS